MDYQRDKQDKLTKQTYKRDQNQQTNSQTVQTSRKIDWGTENLTNRQTGRKKQRH